MQDMSHYAGNLTKARRVAKYPPPRHFDAPEFLNDCLAQLNEEEVVVLYLTDANNKVTGVEIVAPGRGVVATVNIVQHNE